MRRTAAKAALLAAGLIAGLLVAEVAVRGSGAARPAELGEMYDRPPVLYKPAPGREHPWGGQDEDVLRVAVIGDSFTVGEGVQVYDAYPARLERLLNLNPGMRPVRVSVHGARGTATEGQLGHLLEALRAGTDLVIVGFVLNDTESWKDPTVQDRRAATLPRVPTGWKVPVLRRWHTARLAYHKLEQTRAQRALLAYYRDNFEPDYVGWERFREALGYFAGNCRRRNVPLIGVILPGMFQLDPERYPFRYAHERMSAALTEASIPHVDLLDRFLGRSELRLAVEPGLDGHPNEIAHRLAAEEIFEYLLASGAIDAAYRPVWREAVSREQSLRRARRVLTPTALAD